MVVYVLESAALGAGIFETLKAAMLFIEQQDAKITVNPYGDFWRLHEPGRFSPVGTIRRERVLTERDVAP